MESSAGFRPPKRGIFTPREMELFLRSQTFTYYMDFVRHCNEAVRGKSAANDFPVSPVVDGIVKMLQEMADWVSDFPPLDQPMRFGNKAFRGWHARVVERAPKLVSALLPAGSEAAEVELTPYLASSFGHEQRIDYGTGHETNFVVWLCCLYKLGALKKEDLPAAILRGFKQYLELMRTLHRAYLLEPAGSHGVWGLDDYHCLPFLWGSSQLTDSSMTPDCIHDETVLTEMSDQYLYFSAITFIKSIKHGAPFGECCPMLNDISGLPSWRKVNMGMLRLYEGDVMGKMPVIQHFLFGSLLPCDWEVTPPAGRASPVPPEDFDPFTSACAPWAVGSMGAAPSQD